MVLKMIYDAKFFDEVFERRGHDATKWDYPLFVKDNKDIVPMWVADMDFRTPDCIVDAMAKRLEHHAFGYFKIPQAYFDGIAKWQKERYGVDGVTADQVDYQNGVLGGVSSFVEAYSLPGDWILLNDTCYTGFQSTIANRGRNIVYSPVKETADGWALDIEDMEKKIIEKKPPIMIFCNPHNPTGHVWSKEEMIAVVELCDKYGMLICSDEIWADFQTGGHKHVPLHTCCPRAKEIVFSMYAPSKTFNLAGLVGSYHVIFNKYLRERMDKVASLSHYNSINVMSMHALVGAYSETGREWVDELLEVLSSNVNYAYDYICKNFKGVKLAKPEGTYMLYLDCEEWCKEHNMSMDDLLKAGVAVGVIWQDGRPSTVHSPFVLTWQFRTPVLSTLWIVWTSMYSTPSNCR